MLHTFGLEMSNRQNFLQVEEDATTSCLQQNSWVASPALTSVVVFRCFCTTFLELFWECRRSAPTTPVTCFLG